MELSQLNADFRGFIRHVVQQYGIDVVSHWLEDSLNISLDDVASYRYNLMEVFAKHQTTPLQIGSLIFLDKYRMTDDYHRIERTEPGKETWVYSKDGVEIRIGVRKTSSSYTWICEAIYEIVESIN